MYKEWPGGSVYDVQGLECQLPRPGWVYNHLSGNLEYVGIYERSKVKEEQYWEREMEPVWYKLKQKAEAAIQLKQLEAGEEVTHFDPECEAYRESQWFKRLNGMWFYNNGKPCYITGLHWMFCTHWQIDIGIPKFRIPDLEYFYFLQYCLEDPVCMGMVEVTKRRFGKTYRSGIFLYEYTSRTKEANAGLQSKTDTDAKKVFSKAIVRPFKKLPHFFRPEYDRSQGITPKSELRFEQTNVRGKKAESTLEKDELNSVIDFQASEPTSYDGSKLHRLLHDEVGKAKKIDVYERWDVCRYCLLDDEGRIIGKALLTTTVEEMEKGGEKFKLIWDDSDHTTVRNDDGTTRKRRKDEGTASGLYRFFMSAKRTRNFDRYGYPDEALTTRQILSDRAKVKHSPKRLSALMRKEPLTIEEAFRIDGGSCMFNDVNLNNRLTEIMPDDVEFGNLSWPNGGVQDSGYPVWKSDPQGRWMRSARWKPTPGVDVNICEKRGERFFPDQDWRHAQGSDPYEVDTPENGKGSMGASLVKLKAAPHNPVHPRVGGYVLGYLARPRTADLFYEDMILQCVYTGAKMLVESNKQGQIKYFRWRGYGQFLMHLKGNQDVGIASSETTKQQGAQMVEALIENHIDKVDFVPLIKDWLVFDITKTKIYDFSMASLWTEWAAQFRYEAPPPPEEVQGVNEQEDGLLDWFDVG
jgi:hypothetical protein